MINKKYKRFLSTLMAFIFCFCLSFSVVSCKNKKSNGNDSSNNSSSNISSESVENSSSEIIENSSSEIISESSQESSSNEDSSSDSSASENVIKTLYATGEIFPLEIGKDLFLTDCYGIEGFSELAVYQKRCTYTSSNEKVAKVVGKKLVGIDSGVTQVTVTSVEDTTKSCTFSVKVGKVFIDRTNSYILDDDFTHEWNQETDEPGWFRTTSKYANNFYHIKGIDSTVWYVETTIKVHEFGDVSQADGSRIPNRWPKIGIVARDSINPSDMVTFFMSATIGINDTWPNGQLVYGADNNYWNEFGVCEIKNGQWAWNGGIPNSVARHHDYAWFSDGYITYETEFTLGVARVGLDFHIYINGAYKGSYKIEPSLQILSSIHGIPAPSKVAFYGFNTDATFSNYYQTTDADEIANKYTPKTPIYTGFLPD